MNIASELGEDLGDDGDSPLDTWSLVVGRSVLKFELLESFNSSLVVSDLDVVSVEDDALFDSDGPDVLEGSNVSLSGHSDSLVDSGSAESHSSDMSESFEVNLESSLASLGFVVLEARSDSSAGSLKLYFNSFDSSAQSGGSSDSVSFLLYSVSSESANGSSDLSGILLWFGVELGNSYFEGGLLGLERTSLGGCLQRILATTDNSLLLSEALG